MSAQPDHAPLTPYAPAPGAPAELLDQLRTDRWVPAFERGVGGRPSTRPLLRRDDALAALGEAAQWWGCDVPEDPGASELTELVDELVGRLRADQRDERFRNAAGPMAEVAEALGAVSRLGGLLPAVSLWHLRAAVEKERQARGRFARTAIPQPGGKPRSAAPVS